jgi:hypothetical protein
MPWRRNRILAGEKLDPLFGDQDIGRLEVAMRNALAVRRIQRLQNLPRVFDGLVDGQRAFQRRALDKLHHQVAGSDVVEHADVRVVQRRHGAVLSLEAFRELLFGNLDGDDATVASVARFPHLTHATGADDFEGLVWSEPLAPRKAGHDLLNYIGECLP